MVRARALAAPWLQIVLPAEAPSSPSSYAAALMHPPTLDFLRGQHAEEDSDEEEPFPNARRGPAFGKTRSLPSRLALATEDSDEDSPRPSAWTFQKTNSLPTPCCQLPETTLVLGDAKDDAPRSTVARTLLEQRPVQTCKGWTPELSSKPQLAEEVFSQIPSVQNLRRMFIVKVSQMESCEAAVHAATEELNRTCKVGFQDSDAERIYSMLSQNGKDEISCQSFAVGMRELLCALTSCGSQLSLPQLRIIMATAFDRFDRNDDGVLSVEEFSSALRSFDIHMGIEETASLLRFLGPVCEQESPVLEREDLANVDGSELTLEEKCSAAVNAMQEKVKSAIGWNTAVQIGEKVNECWQEPGSPGHKVQRLLDLGHKELATATEASLTVAGIAAVLLHHSQFHADAAFFEQMHDAVDDFMGAVKDLEASVILPALVSGALGLAKTQKDSVALDVEEAFLYVRYFLSKGCSQSLFHKLINLADCHWGSVSAGEPLPEAKGELQILVRGKVVMKHGEDEVELLPGAFLNSCCDSQQPPEEVALEDVTYVAWDTEKLQECIEHSKDANLKSLVQEMLEDARCVCDADSASSALPGQWETPVDAVGAALERQAQRRGLPSTSGASEALCRILAKPIGPREKLDQFHAWILSSKDEILDGVEAVGDLVGLCSLLSALSTHSATLSPENFSQLAPLLILLADLASKRGHMDSKCC